MTYLKPIRCFASFFAMAFMAIFITGCDRFFSSSKEDINTTKEAILKQIDEIIKHDPHISKDIKNTIALKLTELSQKSHISFSDLDKTARPAAVNIQKALEQCLPDVKKEKNLAHITSVIHTLTRPTPLCNEPQKPLHKESIIPAIQQDPDRLKTVQSRPESLRYLVSQANSRLYSAYPKQQNSVPPRSKEELTVYGKALQKYPNIMDFPLSCNNFQLNELQNNISGASYLLKTHEGKFLFFNMLAFQANQGTPKNLQWQMWFDSMETPEIKSRYETIKNFLTTCGGSIDF